MKTFREVIDRWPSKPAFAAQMGENKATVRQWYARDHIPAGKLLRVVECAQAVGFNDITYPVLTEIAKAPA